MRTWRLPAQARSASQARQLLRDALQESEGAAGASQALADDASLLVSELVTNAVIHGRSDVTMAVELVGHRLRVEVADGCADLPVRRADSSEALGGRGVALVDAYADRWGVEPTPPQGKTVWFELLNLPG